MEEKPIPKKKQKVIESDEEDDDYFDWKSHITVIPDN